MTEAPELITILVRSLVEKDITTIVNLGSKNKVLKAKSEKDFKRLLKKRNIVTFVAVYEDKILGFVLIETVKDYFNILNLFVHPDHIRKGIGTALINHLFTQLRSSYKYEKIITFVSESNLAVQLFLRSNKFRCVETITSRQTKALEDIYKFEFRAQWPEKVITKDTKGHFVK